MSGPDLTGNGKRVLVLGAETEVGHAVVSAVAGAGASVAAVAAKSDAEAAFAVQRLARRLASHERKVIAQAIDATNEAAVRVMVRQVSKELGGLDAVVWCGDELGVEMIEAMKLINRLGRKEIERRGGGRIVLVPQGGRGIYEMVHFGPPSASETVNVQTVGLTNDEVAAEVIRAIAGEVDSG